LGKPVVVGPVTWTIEFPAEEALAAKVLHRVSDPAEMVEPLMGWMNGLGDAQAARRAALAFAAQHSGASNKHLRLLLDWMAGR
jgi:3-deoxy-D-manno-octulosonic-acid transferase